MDVRATAKEHRYWRLGNTNGFIALPLVHPHQHGLAKPMPHAGPAFKKALPPSRLQSEPQRVSASERAGGGTAPRLLCQYINGYYGAAHGVIKGIDPRIFEADILLVHFGAHIPHGPVPRGSTQAFHPIPIPYSTILTHPIPAMAYYFPHHTTPHRMWFHAIS